MLRNPYYDAFENDIGVVNFYFDKSTVLEFKRAQRMKTEDYISQMGGLIGLGIGFSFVSAVEIIYWITIRLIYNISAHDKMNSKKEQKKKRLFQSSYCARTFSRNAVEPTNSGDNTDDP